jgi:dihydrofolate reductase
MSAARKTARQELAEFSEFVIDEYRFVVLPTIVGEGRRLMEGVSLPEKLQLKLIESKPFKSGCVALRYLKQ